MCDNQKRNDNIKLFDTILTMMDPNKNTTFRTRLRPKFKNITVRSYTVLFIF